VEIPHRMPAGAAANKMGPFFLEIEEFCDLTLPAVLGIVASPWHHL
jgi:hypothetical protein